ncbi:hypothetical protein L596_016081 [Steinernema carpocapsae]|uniref:Lipase n=1 Tax=Steinernema carpocapsae TaxID=34508 RepID=A0A4U5NI50_STECR|nr:hypothetical protein L596_016081 [Steinernema carpocapsae]
MLKTVLWFALLTSAWALDPESGKPVPEIVARWGYPVETNTAVTSDGYILTIHRIPHGKTNVALDKPRPIVFLQHGFLGNSNNWITNLPHLSFGYLLADAGFDVWMGNMRGNNYSLNHTRLDVNSREFWNFSWDQMFKHDLTAMIDKALERTGQESLFYVGHSQGTMTMFAKLTEEPEFGSKIKKFYAFAPVTAAENMKGLMALTVRNFYPTFKELHRNGTDHFLPDSDLFKEMKDQFCDSPYSNILCFNFVLALAGPSRQVNQSRLDVFLTEIPAGTSMLNAIHSAQLILSGEYKAFDYEDPILNTKHYGQVFPPHYDLSKISNVKIGVYYSDFDFVATTKDIQRFLFKKLPKEVTEEKVKLFRFNHMDFVWGKNAAKDLYGPVMEDMRKLL